MLGFVINLDNRPDRLNAFKENKFPFEIERFRGIKSDCGEDGFTKSTITLIKQQTKFPFVVFEDDCIMLESWNVVEDAMKQLPDYWDALWLGATLTIPLERYSKNLFKLKRAYTTHSIIYNSLKMINFICNLNIPKRKNLDIFYFSMVQDKFNCFITYPIVATQRPGISDISGQYTNSEVIVSSYNKYTHEIS